MPINVDHSGNIIVTDDGELEFQMTGSITVPVGTTGQRPSSPAAGMIRYNTTLSTFEGYTSSWQDLLAGGGGGGASVTVSDTPPLSPSEGDLWFDQNDGTLNVYYNDGDSSQWVVTSGPPGVSIATGGNGDQVFWENEQTVTADYTITDGRNALSSGPITIDTGVTVTIGDGETWRIV